MEPIQPIDPSSNSTRLYANPSDRSRESRFDATIAAAAASGAERAPEQWASTQNSPITKYREELQRLFDETLVDQALSSASISVLISEAALERMGEVPEFESRILNSLYNGMHAALALAPFAYLLLKVRGDGTVESSSGAGETLSEYEEEAARAFWTRKPVGASRDSTDSRRMAYSPPKPRRKLNRRRIRVWLERRRRRFLAKQKSLYDFLAGIGGRPRITPATKDDDAGNDQDATRNGVE